MKQQKAFVLIKTDPGREREVADKLNKLDEVKEVHIITGDWDILAVNNDAIQIAREFGFERGRELVRMAFADVRNLPPLRNSDALVFATAGFEFG